MLLCVLCFSMLVPKLLKDCYHRTLLLGYHVISGEMANCCYGAKNF